MSTKASNQIDYCPTNGEKMAAWHSLVYSNLALADWRRGCSRLVDCAGGAAHSSARYAYHRRASSFSFLVYQMRQTQAIDG